MNKGLNWIGDYSRFSNDPAKDYVMVLKEQGKVLLDDEINTGQELIIERFRKIIRTLIPSGSPDAGYKVVGTGATNDFTIKAGNILLDGWLLELPTDIVYSGQPIAPTMLTTPNVDRTDKVYLDIWLDEVDGVADPNIVDPTFNARTSCRLAVKWSVRVAEGGAVPASGLDVQQLYHWYLHLATISRAASDATITAGMVADARPAFYSLGENEAPPKTVSANYMTTRWDFAVYVDTSAGDRTITLADYESVSASKRFRVKNIGPNKVFITTDDGKTVDGLASITLETAGDRASVEKDGANWQTF